MRWVILIWTPGPVAQRIGSRSIFRVGGSAVGTEVPYCGYIEPGSGAETCRQTFSGRSFLSPECCHHPNTPLRAHREDIPDLIQHYVQLITDSQHLPFRRFSTSSVNYLRNRPWPGNVRELINFIHRVLLTTSSEVIEAEETREVMGQSATPLDAVEEKNAWRDFGQPLRTAREHFERDYLEFHLLQTRGNISELARRAELERTHLYRKLKGLGLNPKDEKYRQ